MSFRVVRYVSLIQICAYLDENVTNFKSLGGGCIFHRLFLYTLYFVQKYIVENFIKDKNNSITSFTTNNATDLLHKKNCFRE